MTTREAYKQMINVRNIAKTLKLDDNYIRVHRNKVNNLEEYPSIDKMEERLEKAGWKVIQEKLWKE
jgi:hypothetical protein